MSMTDSRALPAVRRSKAAAAAANCAADSARAGDDAAPAHAIAGNRGTPRALCSATGFGSRRRADDAKQESLCAMPGVEDDDVVRGCGGAGVRRCVRGCEVRGCEGRSEGARCEGATSESEGARCEGATSESDGARSEGAKRERNDVRDQFAV